MGARRPGGRQLHNNPGERMVLRDRGGNSENSSTHFFILMFRAHYVQMLFWALGRKTDKATFPGENLNKKHMKKWYVVF